MLKILSCLSSLPGHHACGPPALPCWPSRRGSSSSTTPHCRPSLPGHPSSNATDQGSLGGDKLSCNNFPNVTFVFNDKKTKMSDKCGLASYEKIINLVENIAMYNLEVSKKKDMARKILENIIITYDNLNLVKNKTKYFISKKSHLKHFI